MFRTKDYVIVKMTSSYIHACDGRLRIKAPHVKGAPAVALEVVSRGLPSGGTCTADRRGRADHELYPGAGRQDPICAHCRQREGLLRSLYPGQGDDEDSRDPTDAAATHEETFCPLPGGPGG